MIPEYHLAICGTGPANISPLVYLEEENKLDSLLNKGVIAIDKSLNVGLGALGEYKITANSIGSVFFEIFKNCDSDLFKFINKKSSYSKLKEYELTAPPLPLVGDFLSDIGRFISNKIINNSNSELCLSSQVTEIKLRTDNKFEVTYQNLLSPGAPKKILAKNIFFNIGGIQTSLFKNYKFPDGKVVCNSNEFLQGKEDEKIHELIADRTEPIEISIIGSSHSAFSCLYRFKNHFSLLNPEKSNITLIHRSPIKLFYNSLDEATSDHYPVDLTEDICKLSGRINRYSGLRYDSFFLGREVLNNIYPNICLKSVEKLDNNIINSSQIVINATGYKSNIIEIIDNFGRAIPFAKENGSIITNHNCNPILTNGEYLDNFFTFGLGSGLRTSSENGGELNYKGRIDGVWVYQHEVGPRIECLVD
ncbi:malate:quinone oxidoreductase [Lysinibacillus sphaericus]|uniref:Malate:quinone oxidoreductase n=1 Tax=Lysinibacillus sphaericus TaxID=1421 RepID=A0A2S5CV40_LYSSH|nr:hypothetical protein [Lysinibacillus sphaericus]POZ54689.1 malate:quinone oxidoreductase [Lysinibacillus sphaericus]